MRSNKYLSFPLTTIIFFDMQIQLLSNEVSWGSHVYMGPGAKCALANSEHTQLPWVSEAVDWIKCFTAQPADWISIAIMEEIFKEVLHPFAVATSTQMFPWHQLSSKQISETPVRALKSVGDSLTEIWIGIALPGSHQDMGADANNASLAEIDQNPTFLCPCWETPILPIIQVPVWSPFQRSSHLTLTSRFSLNLYSM